MTQDNTLYYGDNLEVLRKYIKSESIDLIYLDPPFNSQATYNVLFKEVTSQLGGGEKSKAQIQAFTDTWTWNLESQKTFEYLTTNKEVPAQTTDLILSLERLLGKNSMSAYLVMMTVRLLEMRRVLKPTGSIYLHCDPNASHYLKILLDAIFMPQNFRNEIIWKRANAHNDPNRFGNVSDILLFYSKGGKYIWNTQYVPYDKEYIESHWKRKNAEGRPYRLMPLDAPRHGDGGNLVYEWHGKMPASTRTWSCVIEKMREYEEKGLLEYTSTGTPCLRKNLDDMLGLPLQNIWTDIPPVNPMASERLGYPTQKPVALLERIIKSSSNDDAVILDPFCGCGTTIDAVEKVNAEMHSNRKWIGIDITHLAINLIKRRIKDKYPNAVFEVIGEPRDLEGAKQLAHSDRYQFEWWALSLIDARPINDKKKGSDKGIDGIIYLLDPRDNSTKTVLVQVKSGHVKSGDIRDFKGTLEREKTHFGIFITLEEPTRDMKDEAIAYGFEASPLGHEQIQRIQILTIKQLLEGIKPKVSFVNVSYKKAEKTKETKAKKPKLKKLGRNKKL